ncbi:hypothetical protein [Staphylococcus capitis]|uniref:Uncharacterized protein n=2 Tax=Staphylococcus capitis TaxID=29388 RepID=A0ABX1SNT5_STACP|nr:hypothetical protein [Staphylococcus capitis]NMK53971.1 hypothetical protein [Staphylococcus capitis]NMK69336.1 hypothetical protein [Staphylococcus capitis]
MAKNDNKKPFLKYYRLSLTMLKVIKIWLFVFVGILLIRLLLLKGLSKVVHFITDTVKHNPNGYLKDLFPHANHWGNKFDEKWLFSIDSFLTLSLVITVLIVGAYIVLIGLRHRNGEHAPFINDLESKKIRRFIIKTTEATNKKTYKDENKKIRKYPRKEVQANRQIRKCEVEIHTFNKNNMSKPFKTYRVAFKRLRSNKSNAVMWSKIKDIHENLNSEIDASFSKVDAYQGYYTSSVEKQLDKEKKSLIVKLRERKLVKEGEIVEESEYAFPLTKFKDRTATIETQKEKADLYAEELQEAMNIHLSSKGVYADKTERFIENTSVEFEYTLPPNTTKAPNTEELEKTIDTSLDVEGSRVKMRGRKLIVTVSLPKDCVVPIDVKTMIEAIF